MRDYLAEEALHVFELCEPLHGRRHTAHLLADGLLHGVMGGGHGGIIRAVAWVVSIRFGIYSQPIRFLLSR